MNTRFNFTIKNRGHNRVLSFTLPTQNGGVITNQYCPQMLLTGGLSFVTAVNGECIPEFEDDCRKQIVGMEAAGGNSTVDTHIAGLMAAVMDHINRCGRLIFGDLLIYMDVFSHLLVADGHSDAEVKNIYPRILRSVVELYPEYIKNTADLSQFKGSVYDIILASLTK